ncbi:MAG TPA: hypothetical protein VGX96_16420 [Candidatus Elarobacter sp.]|jgi:hypothetical protein|nr:hypothetical protein [Candidatus Elarobacter sp.]
MKQPADENRREVRGFRIDLAIAICALFVSTLATGASWWQSRVVQQQLSAQVWPYVAIDTTTGSDSVRVALVNYGLGPALVRDAVITVDGRPQYSLAAAVVSMIKDPSAVAKGRSTKATAHFSLSSIGPGSVIRPGDSHNLIDVSGSRLLAERLIAARARTNVILCYCSILDQCWRIVMDDANGAPQQAACDQHDPNALHPFDARDIAKYLNRKP